MPKPQLTSEQKKMAAKQAAKVEKQISKLRKEDVLTDEQLELYKKASEPRRAWLEMFIRCGDIHESTRHAYPNHESKAAIQMTSYKVREYWGIDIGQIFRAMGIDEVEIGRKTQTLLNAKRVKRTYIKGELTEETEEEDNYAISKGLDIAIGQTGNSPTQKKLIGEDPNNRFKGLAGLMKAEQDEDDEEEEEAAEYSPDDVCLCDDDLPCPRHAKAK